MGGILIHEGPFSDPSLEPYETVRVGIAPLRSEAFEMKALHLTDSLRLDPNFPSPIPPAGEALVRPLLVGVCKTDLELTAGYMGFRGVLGHEFVGVVEHSDQPEWVGARVVGEINCAPPNSPPGLDPRHLPDRTVLGILDRNGVMAERFCLPLANLLRVPEGVPNESAVFCEPLAAAFRILEQVDPLPKRAVVVGDGRLGLLCALALHRSAVEVTLLGKHPSKMEPLPGEIHRATLSDHRRRPLSRAPLVIEATGSPSGLPLALELTQPLGTLVLKTTIAEPHQAHLAAIVIDELTVLGSRCGLFAPALEALADGSIDPRFMIEAVYPLEGALEAFDRAARPGAGKVLIEVSK